MKVSWIYRALFFIALGFALGTFVTAKVFINNLPPTTEISIGRVKVKGKGNTIDKVMEVDDVTQSKEKKNRIFKGRDK